MSVSLALRAWISTFSHGAVFKTDIFKISVDIQAALTIMLANMIGDGYFNDAEWIRRKKRMIIEIKGE